MSLTAPVHPCMRARRVGPVGPDLTRLLFPLFFLQDDEEDSSTSLLGQKKPGYHAPVAILNAIPQSEEQVNVICACGGILGCGLINICITAVV